MQTDTEVLAYAVDLLMRRQNLPIELVAQVLARRFGKKSIIWNLKSELLRTLRQTYGSLLMNGPFGIVIAIMAR